MGVYSFKTDENLEKSGIYLQYGDFRVKVARAGGSNKRYAKALEKETRDYRSAIKNDQMPEDKAAEIMRRVFASTVILGWETKVEGEWRSGIEAEDGTLLQFSQKNVESTLENLPDLFADIQEQATKFSNFRAAPREADLGNSSGALNTP